MAKEPTKTEAYPSTTEQQAAPPPQIRSDDPLAVLPEPPQPHVTQQEAADALRLHQAHINDWMIQVINLNQQQPAAAGQNRGVPPRAAPRTAPGASPEATASAAAAAQTGAPVIAKRER